MGGTPTEHLLQNLGIAPEHCAPQEEFCRCVAEAGYDLDSVFESGNDWTSALVQDAIFATERTAQMALSGNLERILALAKECDEATAPLEPSSIADIGGASGVVVFHAAKLRPDHHFVVLDRSENALRIGRGWADKLGLQNVKFTHVDFESEAGDINLPRDCRLSLLAYVLNMHPESLDDDDMADAMAPALRTAAKVSRESGSLIARFGEYSYDGLVGLAKAAHRSAWALSSVTQMWEGTSCVFRRDGPLAMREEMAVDEMVEAVAAAQRRYEGRGNKEKP